MNWHHQRLRTAAILAALGCAATAVVPYLPAQATTPKPFQISRGVSWDDIFRILKPKRKSGGSRDGSLCVLSINKRADVRNYVMNLHPSLVWKGPAKSVSLHRFGERRAIWKKSLNFTHQGIQRVRYSGIPLMPGGRYTWKIQGATIGRTEADFIVLSALDRGRLQAELNTIPGKDETSVLKRTDIYRNFQLGQEQQAIVVRSDALNEILSIRNRSEALTEQIENLPASWCPQPNTAS